MRDVAMCSGVTHYFSTCPMILKCKRHKDFALRDKKNDSNQNNVMPDFKGKTCPNFVEEK